MKYITIIAVVSTLLAGCAYFEEAYYVDREFGTAQMESWDKHVAYPDYRHAEKNPETMEGIHAEEVMSVYNRTFAEKPAKSDVLEFGIVED